MIILPDRNIPRAKFLLPMARQVWQRLPPYVIGQTWIAQLFRADRSMVWQGHFEDREDADEFMAAMFAGTLKADGYLQRLPVYCPDFEPHLLDDPGISYNMVTNIGIGPSSGNWSVPGDCVGLRSKAGEFVDVIAGGGSGAAANGGFGGAGGGGGGQASLYSYALTPGGLAAYSSGAGGAAVSRSGSNGGTVGNAGADTWFVGTSTVRASGGGGGQSTTVTAYSAGGTAGTGTNGSNGHSGGAGGGVQTGSAAAAAGGGGAAGPSGGGSTASDAVSNFATGSGGAGHSGSIAGGGSAGATGGTGNWYGPWGPGGGGAGNYSGSATPTAGSGGYSGGGGGGAAGVSAFGSVSGSGSGGLIVIRYEPVTQHTVTSITPSSGPTGGGQSVTIGGANFESGLMASANIGGASVSSFAYASTTTATGVTTAGGPGLYSVNVAKTGATTATGTNLYRYVTPPAVSSVSSNVGPIGGGQAVTVTGTGFTGASLSNVSSVTFGGTAATSIVVVNDTTITCVTPAHAAGAVNVVATNTYGSGTGTNVYTYGLLATVSSCSPDIGLIFGNTLVTLTGANFTGTTVVRFGGSNATSVSVTNSTTITCRTTAHAKGLVSVDVTNTYGLGTGSSVFTYLLPASGFNMPMMGV